MRRVISNAIVSSFDEIYRFPKLADCFVRVYAVGHISAGVAEDAADRIWIRPGIVEQRRAGMTAVVCCMSGAADSRHDALPKCTVAGVGVGMAVWIGDEIFAWHFHPSFDKRPYSVVDGDDADAGGRLRVTDVKKALPPMNVCFS